MADKDDEVKEERAHRWALFNRLTALRGEYIQMRAERDRYKVALESVAAMSPDLAETQAAREAKQALDTAADEWVNFLTKRNA